MSTGTNNPHPGNGNLFQRCLPVVALLLYLAAGPAAADNGQSAFAAGVEASRTGDHRRALQHFLTARRRGLDSTALYFNLGVSHYHLGQLDKAEAAFRRIAGSDKMAALVYYNLGLIANDRGETRRAIRYFERARRQARTEKLRRLSRLAVARITPAPRPEEPRAGVWVELGGGHDDNALLIPDQSAADSGRGDALARLTAYGYAQLTGRARDGLKLEGYIQNERYDDFNEFDLDVYQLGPAYAWSAGRWRYSAAVALRHINLDGGDFQDTRTASFTSRRRLSDTLELRLRAAYESLDSDSAFAFLDGDRRTAGVALTRSGPRRWRLGYRYEDNDREDRADNDGGFRSFSPASHRFSADWETALAGRLTFSAGLEHKRSRYPDAEVRAGETMAKREDERNLLSLGLQHPLGRGWRTGLELLFYDNDSNYAEFRYERGVVTLSVDKHFEAGG